MAKNNSKSNTKDRIINSAKKLFAEQGYQKTTVMDISKQAGLSEAALYEYFQGKEDLLLTIPDLWVSELIEDLKEQGKSIIMVSEELPELIGMADRIIIMKNGSISGEYMRDHGLEEIKLVQSMI